MTTTAQNHSNDTSPDGPDEEDRARRGHLLPDHLRLDPHTRPPPLRPRERARTSSSAPAPTPARSGAAFLEVIVALAGIGTAITLYPVVKRQNEGMALGFVASRTLEAAMLFTGVASILSLVTLHQDLGTATGADAASLVTIGASHVATYHWAFTLGGSLMPGINAILLGTLLYRSGLVPRVLPVIGLIGAPLHLTAVVLTMFGVVDRVGTVTGIAAVPIAVWELSLGVYLIVKGFKPCPITDAIREDATPPARSAVVA